ncbi:helix-turn-helix domain-containing protein [Rhodococcus sp. IEGM 1318]|uniref:helix-turn-helix domain-containing protein n=1 Tax=Rhodococcus sp. IEGM 1318 TaxID=3082226 RepID=UPI0029553A64|nr:helix-turn-helix domain-containing protein [Rhodococcus sp. IEGM 1318]MDV8005889.1 helix-turn-helix domain-containing protein [Rhodococcus sp. IEGM 1318]
MEETGLTFTRWRLRTRIAASSEYLKQNREIGWIAKEFGSETGSGFTRAFRARTGESASDYHRRVHCCYCSAPVPRTGRPYLPTSSELSSSPHTRIGTVAHIRCRVHTRAAP